MAPPKHKPTHKHVAHFTKAAPIDPHAKPTDIVLRLHTKGPAITAMQNDILALDANAQIGGTISLKAKKGHLNHADGFFNNRTQQWLKEKGYDASKGLTQETLARLHHDAELARHPGGSAPVATASAAAPIVVNEAGIPTFPIGTPTPAGAGVTESSFTGRGKKGSNILTDNIRITGDHTIETDSVSVNRKPDGTGRARSLQDLRLLTAAPGDVADVRTRTDRTVTINGARATTDERLLNNRGHQIGEFIAVESTKGGQSDLKVYQRSRSFLFFHKRKLMSDTTLTPASGTPALVGNKPSAPAGLNTPAYGNLRTDAQRGAAASDLRAEVASNLGNQAGYTVQSTVDTVKPKKKPASPAHGL